MVIDRKFSFDPDVDIRELFAFCDLHVSRTRDEYVVRLPHRYDRQGFPIPGDGTGNPDASLLAWAKLHADDDYRIVARDELPGGTHLSTVWLGMDHGFGGPPLIFETMRFESEASIGEYEGSEYMYHKDLTFPVPGEDYETDQLRYTTEEEALASHHEIVRLIVRKEGH